VHVPTVVSWGVQPSPSQPAAHPPDQHADLVIIGAGAAGLMAAIWASRAANESAATHPLRIIALDGARKLGAKILVAGGGRCNVTHHAVDESAYAGSSKNSIKKVLRSFDIPRTIAFFRELGVELKREDTGKLFPTTDDAHTVLDALLRAATTPGPRGTRVEIIHPWRVGSITHTPHGFLISRDLIRDAALLNTSPNTTAAATSIHARRIILAAGGMALPKSGSDGQAYAFARALGHSVTPRIFPSLVPLTLPQDHFICSLSGLTLFTTLDLWSHGGPGRGKRLVSFTNSTLCTHFGLSGPAVLDISRYYLDAAAASTTAPPVLTINWLGGHTTASGEPIPTPTTAQIDEALAAAARTPKSHRDPGGTLGIARWLTERMSPPIPDRLARALCTEAHIPDGGSAPLHTLTRDTRLALATLLTATPIPVTGSRGFTFAEVTAGGIPLAEIALDAMESRTCPGLHICGEICDVDGRIGGFNFQWAWASGYLAGLAAARSLNAANTTPHP
jgi:predicted Rossmann fold flavoprotein